MSRIHVIHEDTHLYDVITHTHMVHHYTVILLLIYIIICYCYYNFIHVYTVY